MDKHTQNITTQLIDYREGNLTELQIVEVERQLESSQEWQMIFKELAFIKIKLGLLVIIIACRDRASASMISPNSFHMPVLR